MIMMMIVDTCTIYPIPLIEIRFYLIIQVEVCLNIYLYIDLYIHRCYFIVIVPLLISHVNTFNNYVCISGKGCYGLFAANNYSMCERTSSHSTD